MTGGGFRSAFFRTLTFIWFLQGSRLAREQDEHRLEHGLAMTRHG